MGVVFQDAYIMIYGAIPLVDSILFILQNATICDRAQNTGLIGQQRPYLRVTGRSTLIR